MAVAGIVLIVLALALAFVLFGAVWSILYYLAAGLIVGALARLVLPGKENIGLLGTSLVGIGGSLLGGVLGRALHVGWLLQLAFAVAAAAVLLTALGFRENSKRKR